MKTLLVEVVYEGWRLRNWSNERMHWAARRRLMRPPVPPRIRYEHPDARVAGPHKRRDVWITRIGKRLMDEDGLGSAVKPVVDKLKTARMRLGNCEGPLVPGWIYDDAPKYCKLHLRQETGKDYGVRIEIYG